MRVKLFIPVVLHAFLPCMAFAMPVRHIAEPLVEMERLVMTGHADEATTALRMYLETNAQDGDAHLLLCRAYYSEQKAEPAVSECEAALHTLGSSSVAQDWMGRAYGIKADHAGPVGGFRLAARVKAAFEKAVELDAHNADAVNDAGDYYVNAPSIVGGGIDKAFALADKVAASLPQAAHRIRALGAEKNKDFGTAEREFRDAVGAGGHAEAWVDLGLYYSRRSQKTEALDAFQHAIAADRKHGPALVDVAAALIAMNTQTDVAARALRDYLASNAKSDDAPAFRAMTELGKALEQAGNKDGARVQYENALSLAKDYEPAKKALGRN